MAIAASSKLGIDATKKLSGEGVRQQNSVLP
jgi:hypothetical protein